MAHIGIQLIRVDAVTQLSFYPAHQLLFEIALLFRRFLKFTNFLRTKVKVPFQLDASSLGNKL